MIHLFNKVYIEQDRFLSNNIRFVRISNTYSFSGLEEHENKISSYSNYDEFLTSEKTLKDFFLKMLQLTDKVIIYADNFSFAKLLTFWYKSITNMDNDSFSIFVDCYEHKIKSYSKNNEQLSLLLKQFWIDTEIQDFSNVNFHPPFEFNFPTCVENINSKFLDSFKKTLLLFVKRDCELLILEARKHLDTYILNHDIQKILGGENKTIKNFNELPKMSVYRKPYWKEIVDVPTFSSYQPGSDSKIDLSLATKEEMIELCSLTDEIKNEIMANTGSTIGATGIASSVNDTRGWKYLDAILRGYLTTEEIRDIIDEMISEKIALIYVPFDLRESILFTFLVYIKSLITQNKKNELYKFTLK